MTTSPKSSSMRPDDVGHAVEALVAAAPAPTVTADHSVALGRRRIARRRLAVTGVAAALLATLAGVGAATRDGRPRPVVSRTATTPPAPATPRAASDRVVLHVRLVCPKETPRPPQPGHPPPGLVPAAIRAVSAHSLWTGATVDAVYPVGIPGTGALADAFTRRVGSMRRARARRELGCRAASTRTALNSPRSCSCTPTPAGRCSAGSPDRYAAPATSSRTSARFERALRVLVVGIGAQRLLGSRLRLAGAVGVDVAGELRHVRQHDHSVVRHLDEAAVHREPLLTAARQDETHRRVRERTEERGMAAQERDLAAAERARDDHVGLADVQHLLG